MLRRWSLLMLLFPGVLPADEVRFLEEIAPVLTQRCLACHNAKDHKGDYRLHTFADLLKPGGSDEKPIVAGNPDASELLRRLTETEASRRMPPGDDPLPAATLARIRQWIAEGAKYEGKDQTALLKSLLPPRKHPEAPVVYRVAAPVFALAFTPDGKAIAVAGHNEVLLYDAATGSLLRRMGKLPARIQSLVFNKAGTHLLVAGGSPGEYGEALLLDLASGSPPRTFGVFDDIVLSAAFSPDETNVAVGSADRWTKVYQTGEGQLLWQSQLHSDWVTAVRYRPDGRFLVTGSKDYAIKVQEADSGKLFTTYNGHRKQFGQYSGQFPVYDVVFAPDSLLAYSAGDGPVVRIWDAIKAQEENGTGRDMEARFAKAGHTKYFPHPSSRAIFKLALSGEHLFAAGGDGVIRQFDAQPDSGKLIREYPRTGDWIFALDVHAPSQRLAAAGFQGEVTIWNTATGERTRSFHAAPGLKR